MSNGLTEAEAKIGGISSSTKLTEDEARILFAKMEKKWDLLGKTGTALHKVAELFWLGRTASEVKMEKDVDILKGQNIDQMWSHLTDLKNKLIDTYGKGDSSKVKFYPEYAIAGETEMTDENGKPIKLLGIIDLLVVDHEGRPHIFDYKCSDKEEVDWHNTKIRTFDYQLSTYKQLLGQYGFPIGGVTLNIVPFVMNNFNPEDGDFESVENGPINYRTNSSNMTVITNELNAVMPQKPIMNITTKDFIVRVNQNIQKIFPNYKFNRDLDDAVIESLKKDVVHDKETGKYILKDKYTGQHIITDTEEEMNSRIAEYHQKLLQGKVTKAESIANALQRAIETGNSDELIGLANERGKMGHKTGWYLKEFERYCNPE